MLIAWLIAWFLSRGIYVYSPFKQGLNLNASVAKKW